MLGFTEGTAGTAGTAGTTGAAGWTAVGVSEAADTAGPEATALAGWV